MAEMNSSIIRSWNGRTVRQREDGYICLTDMAQACGKLVKDWFRLQSTVEYLVCLVASNNAFSIRMAESIDFTKWEISPSQLGNGNMELIEVYRGSFGTAETTGTWAHRKVAIRFAQWCTPAFAVQVDEWIEELMLQGYVSIADMPTPEPKYLPPLEQAEKALDVVEKYKHHFGQMNPQMEQHFKDIVGNCMIDFMELTHQANNGQKECWMGVVNFAEVELGYSVPKKGSFRDSALGTWIRWYYPHLSEKQDRRLCNETQREIWVYPIHEVREQLTIAVHSFFKDPDPGTKLKLEGAFKRK